MVDTSTILFGGGAILAVIGAALFSARKFLLQRSEKELDEIETKYFNEVLITETKNLAEAEDVSREKIENYKSYLDSWYNLKNNRGILNTTTMWLFILFMLTIGYLVLLSADMVNTEYLILFFLTYIFFIYMLIISSKQIRDIVNKMNEDLSYRK
ncbi:MAG: hypothetical protein PHD13_03710 [Methanocellales archaeon]|nr:hypothetical protein [Methanocellales archaeon]MDD3291162.1 hypothetical protein [Methanocellales archaeon]MDD5235262.1 hypothetical protein [Methanocellales archaeon]MDD5484582.1 hypothetical protein [Methanocellales archaeon]